MTEKADVEPSPRRNVAAEVVVVAEADVVKAEIAAEPEREEQP